MPSGCYCLSWECSLTFYACWIAPSFSKAYLQRYPLSLLLLTPSGEVVMICLFTTWSSPGPCQLLEGRHCMVLLFYHQHQAECWSRDSDVHTSPTPIHAKKQPAGWAPGPLTYFNQSSLTFICLHSGLPQQHTLGTY